MKSPNLDAQEGENYDIIMYGGHNDMTAYMDMWIFSPSKKEWFQPDLIGALPSIKGHTAVMYYEEYSTNGGKMIIFGGNVNGVTVNNVYIIEIAYSGGIYYADLIKAETEGDIPEPREGHKAFILESKMIIIGGCDLFITTCFDDIYSLELDKFPLKWTQLQKRSHGVKVPTAREGFGLIYTLENIFIFNGCNFLGQCYKDSYELEIKGDCLFKCPRQKRFFKGQCVCKKGFTGDDCSTPASNPCLYDCNNHGECNEDGKCKCFSNYFGRFCENEICPKNCGGKGLCNSTSLSCNCQPGYFGYSCQATCSKNCSANGLCSRDRCQCKAGYTGPICNKREGPRGCWSFPLELHTCLDLDMSNNAKPVLKGLMTFSENKYIFHEDKSSAEKRAAAPQKGEKVRAITGKLFERNPMTAELYPTNISISVIQSEDLMDLERIDPNGFRMSYAGVRNLGCEGLFDCFGNGICKGKSRTCKCENGFEGEFCQRDLSYEEDLIEMKRVDDERRKEKWEAEEAKRKLLESEFVKVEEEVKIQEDFTVENLVAMNKTEMGFILGIPKIPISLNGSNESTSDVNGTKEDFKKETEMAESLGKILEELPLLAETLNLTKLMAIDSNSSNSSDSSNSTDSNVNVKPKFKDSIIIEALKAKGILPQNFTLPENLELTLNGSIPILKLRKTIKEVKVKKRSEVTNLSSIIENIPDEPTESQIKINKKSNETSKANKTVSTKSLNTTNATESKSLNSASNISQSESTTSHRHTPRRINRTSRTIAPVTAKSLSEQKYDDLLSKKAHLKEVHANLTDLLLEIDKALNPTNYDLEGKFNGSDENRNYSIGGWRQWEKVSNNISLFKIPGMPNFTQLSGLESYVEEQGGGNSTLIIARLLANMSEEERKGFPYSSLPTPNYTSIVDFNNWLIWSNLSILIKNCTEEGSCRCPRDCSGNGKCIDGDCYCSDGWMGEACSVAYCPKNCSFSSLIAGGHCNHTELRCNCFPGFKTLSCGEVIPCPRNCTSEVHGTCLLSSHCNCTEEYFGRDCGKKRCPNNCGGNGECHNGQCVCYDGYYDIDCSLSCPNNCTGHGLCLTGQCLCHRGFGSHDCSQYIECEGNCSGHGKCLLGECICDSGWEDHKCSSLSSCADDCSGRGQCSHGTCLCYPGVTGLRCEFKVQCANWCSNHGKCLWGHCYCDPGFDGLDCSKTKECPNNCSRQGICIKGECYCQQGLSGNDCSKKIYDLSKCEENCHGNGFCLAGKCVCKQGFTGTSCGQEDLIYTANCKYDNEAGICEGFGICLNGKCFCYPGFMGHFCESVADKCPKNCTSYTKGICINNKCVCRPGWEGEDCFRRSKCLNDCSHRGICFKGMCLCDQGYTGNACHQKSKNPQEEYQSRSRLIELLYGNECPGNCHGHGICENSRCICDAEWEGLDCETFKPIRCENSCSDRGICRLGRCFCDPGFEGEFCQHKLQCNDDCSKQGICRHGVCFCFDDFEGVTCDRRKNETHHEDVKFGDITESTLRCPNDCSGKGLCIEGVCYCEEGYFGFNCAFLESDVKVKCLNNCTNQGDCISGKCYCYPGFNGVDCSMTTTFLCPGDGLCSLHGRCGNGKCECHPGFRGRICEELVCPLSHENEECSYHGICKNGNCYCNPGYSGIDCSMKFNSSGCPGDCSSKGKCFEGKCICIEGYSGDDCTITSFRFSEKSSEAAEEELSYLLKDPKLCSHGCNGKGECVEGVCKCQSGFYGPSCEDNPHYFVNNSLYLYKAEAICKSNQTCNYGSCFQGFCECQESYIGEFCDIPKSSMKGNKVNKATQQTSNSLISMVGGINIQWGDVMTAQEHRVPELLFLFLFTSLLTYILYHIIICIIKGKSNGKALSEETKYLLTEENSNSEIQSNTEKPMKPKRTKKKSKNEEHEKDNENEITNNVTIESAVLLLKSKKKLKKSKRVKEEKKEAE